MSYCDCCMKFVLAAVNITTIIFGIALASAGAVIIVKGHVYFPEVPEFSNSFHTPCGVLIGLGVVMILVGSFGCYSAFSAKPALLNCYFFFIFVLALIEIAAAVYVVIQKEPLTKGVMVNIEQWFRNVNHANATELEMVAVSTIQLTFDCCGLEEGPYYWTLWKMSNKVPASCCGSRANPNSAAYYCDRNDPLLQSDPCYPLLHELVFKVLLWGVLGALIGFVVLNSCVMFSSKFLRGSSNYTENDFVYTRYNNHDTANSYTDKTNSTGFNSTWL